MSPSDKIRVVIVDDIAETRENIRKLLQFEKDVEVVGAARTGREGIEVPVRPNQTWSLWILTCQIWMASRQPKQSER